MQQAAPPQRSTMQGYVMLTIMSTLLSTSLALMQPRSRSTSTSSMSHSKLHRFTTTSSIVRKMSNVNDEEGIVLTSSFVQDRASLLESAFEAMDDKDKYDAVLTGLCSKIVDGQSKPSSPNASANGNTAAEEIAEDATLTPTQLAMKTMQDPINLMREMNSSNVKASGRSLMALVDATTTTNDPRTISTILSLALQNKSLSYYGSIQSTITPLPPTPTSKIQGGSSSPSVTRQERLDSIEDVPKDERSKEVTAAISTMGIVGTSFILNGIGNGLDLDAVSFYTSILSYGIIGVLVFDNFLDTIKSMTSLVVKANNDKIPDAVRNMKGPEKEKMPLELGSGKVTGTIVRGLTRLWTVDTERECQCEAAAFYAAYSLGLPCFSFRANALEAAVLVFESQKDTDNKNDGSNMDTLLSDTGIMKMLIWLMAPVAIESSYHPQLIASDPQEARGFLDRLKEKSTMFGSQDVIETILQSTTSNSQDEIEDLLKWAYAEADLLLRQNRVVVTELTERLIGGAATVGDCVSVLEEW